MLKPALGAALLALLQAGTGCIITEDGEGGGTTLELTWECPGDASDLEIMAYPIDEDGFVTGDGVPDAFPCDNAQPARFRYDAGDWVLYVTPTGSRAYYTDWQLFGGEDASETALDFEFDPNMGAFLYTWEIDGANPTTGCNSKDVEEVTLTATVEADPSITFPIVFSCELGAEGVQSDPIPLDTYLVSADAGSEPTALADPFVLEESSGLLELPTIDILIP